MIPIELESDIKISELTGKPIIITLVIHFQVYLYLHAERLFVNEKICIHTYTITHQKDEWINNYTFVERCTQIKKASKTIHSQLRNILLSVRDSRRVRPIRKLRDWWKKQFLKPVFFNLQKLTKAAELMAPGKQTVYSAYLHES